MLGYIYRSVNQSLVDTEKLLKLLNEPTEINDRPDATDLIVEDGEIEFRMCEHSNCVRPLLTSLAQRTLPSPTTGAQLLSMASLSKCPRGRL